MMQQYPPCNTFSQMNIATQVGGGINHGSMTAVGSGVGVNGGQANQSIHNMGRRRLQGMMPCNPYASAQEQQNVQVGVGAGMNGMGAQAIAVGDGVGQNLMGAQANLNVWNHPQNQMMMGGMGMPMQGGMNPMMMQQQQMMGQWGR